MENIESIINTIDFSAYFWEILLPFLFIIGDILSGIIQAINNKNLSSKIMREGLLHKCVLILILLLSVATSFAFNMQLITRGVSLYIIVMETISILENASKSGVDLKGIEKFIKRG